MSNKRITDLTELTTPTTDDVFPVVDIATNTTTKVQLGNLPVPTSVTTALATKENTITPGTTAQYYRGDKSFQTLDKTAVGLGNVDNTSDANKPVSTATQTALNAKQDTLVSGTNIKTINSTSLLGSGNITIAANPSGVSGAIQFSNGSAFASDAANFFWDDTNKRLGVGTNAPVKKLNIVGGDVQIGNSLTSGNFNPATYRTFTIGSDFGSGALQIGNGTTGLMWGGLYANINNVAVYANSRDLTFETPVEAMRITSARNVGIGETTPTARLQVKGSGSTSATTSLLVQNSAGLNSLQVKDDGSVFNLGKGAVSGNLAFGENALINNGTANANTAIGSTAMQNNTTGIFNSSLGNGSMVLNTSGSYNVAIGAESGQFNTVNNDNTSVGYRALRTNTGGSNTAIGSNTSSGNFNGSVILGKDATATASNQFVVGSSTTNAGAVNSTTDVPATFLWSVRINGTNYKILMTT